MFETAQWAFASEAAQSLSQMAARGAKGEAGLGELIRERQDLVAEWQKRDQARSAAISQPPDQRDPNAESENAKRLDAIDARIAAIDKRLNGHDLLSGDLYIADPRDDAPIRIGYCLSLSGRLAGNGQSARLAHDSWREDFAR